MKRCLIVFLLSVFPVHLWAQSPLSTDFPAMLIPPSAELSYTFKLKQGLVSASGNSLITWSAHSGDYKITTQSHVAIIGKVLDVISEGLITHSGLQTQRFYEKSFLKKAQTLLMDHRQHHYIHEESHQQYALPAIFFDRANIVWQISLWLNNNTNWPIPSQTFSYPVAERNGITSWSFSVIKHEQLETPLGILDTYHFRRLANKRGQTIDIWFAKDQHWYPVQIFFNEADGSYFRQTITKISQ